MNTDISDTPRNGLHTLTVSANSPLFDLIDYMEATYDDKGLLIEDLMNYRQHIEEAISHAVYSARERGASWSDVAARLGVSKQAAQQKYGA